jgi:hypothetical protein
MLGHTIGGGVVYERWSRDGRSLLEVFPRPPRFNFDDVQIGDGSCYGNVAKASTRGNREIDCFGSAVADDKEPRGRTRSESGNPIRSTEPTQNSQRCVQHPCAYGFTKNAAKNV